MKYLLDKGVVQVIQGGGGAAVGSRLAGTARPTILAVL